MDLIYRDTARRIIDSPRSKKQMLRMLESIEPVPPKLVTCEIPDDVIEAINKIPERYLVTAAEIKEAMRMNNDIRFYIPEGKTIPIDLELYVGNIHVKYQKIEGCKFRFRIYTDDENEAMEVAQKIASQLVTEHDDAYPGVAWVTVSFEIVPQDERFQMGIIVDWRYKHIERRDSY